jgi:ceramide glucosyltransferase
MDSQMTGLAYGFVLMAGLGLVQCLVGWVAVCRFAARGPTSPTQFPPVTILKPLCGDEPLLEEALASCCGQTYPAFQIVFGVQDGADPALSVIQRLRDRFPRCDINVVIDDTPHGPNRKIANLINMLPSARHDVLVISDSDLHVVPDYLEKLVAALEVPGTGLVTAVFVGLAARRGWPARLGATNISHIFLPGVLVARSMGRQDCLGSTVMLQRQVLEDIGGLQPLATQLAEDNILGQRVRRLGLTVRLADTVSTVTVAETSFHALWQHEIRWSRTIRWLAPIAYAASVIQYPLFAAAMALVLSAGARWSIALFAVTWLVRAACVWGIDRTLRPMLGRHTPAAPYWLLPVRDTLSVVETIVSYWSNEVVWRGHRLTAPSAR